MKLLELFLVWLLSLSLMTNQGHFVDEIEINIYKYEPLKRLSIQPLEKKVKGRIFLAWPLLFGSTLDVERGIFYWRPEPGYVGQYRLIFIEDHGHENKTWKEVWVSIIPKF